MNFVERYEQNYSSKKPRRCVTKKEANECEIKGVGHDICSLNRFIEVKGVSEVWKNYTWQSFHPNEYECLKEHKDKFYLYIVYWAIHKEQRDEKDILERVKPTLYIIPGKDLLDKMKFRIQVEAYSLRSSLGTSLKTRLEKYKRNVKA